MKRTKRTLSFSEDILNYLNTLGLNKYEASIWLALLSKGDATASDLSELANVPRSRSYDVLESLEKKGFVMVKIGKPIKYVAVSPNDVIEKVKKLIEKQSEQKIQNLDKLKTSDIFQELNTMCKINETNDDSIVLLKGRINAYNTIANLLNTAKNSVIVATTENGIARKNAHFKQIFDKIAKKNVSIKLITPKINAEDYKDFLKITDHKISEKLKARVVIIDDEYVFLGMNDDPNKSESTDSMIFLKSKFVANTFKNLLL